MANVKRKIDSEKLLSNEELNECSSKASRPEIVKEESNNQSYHEVLDPSEFDVTSQKASGLLKFNLPAQTKENEITKVTVLNEDETENDIDFREIQKIIRENKKIKKIIIEHVKVNEVGKLQLLFSKKDSGDEPLLDNINNRHQLAIIDIEAKINAKIFGKQTKLIEIEDDPTDKVLDEIDEIRSQNAREYIENPPTSAALKMSLSEERMPPVQEEPSDIKKERRERRINERRKLQREIDQSSNNHEHQIVEEIEEIEKLQSSKDQEQVNFNEGSSVDLKLKEDESDFKNVELKRDTLIRKNRKTQIAKFYYRAENHAELFDLGKSYLHDYENGINNFSFFGSNLCRPKQKTIFGVAAFLNYQSNVNITIVTQSVKDTVYSELLPTMKIEEKFLEKEGIPYKIYVADGVEIIEYEELFNIYSALNIMHFDEFLEEMHLNSDVTIWDLPEMDHLIDYNELFLPIIDVIDNVSLIVKSGLTRTNDIHKQQEFFKTYHIRVKGIIFDKNKLTAKEKKTNKKLITEKKRG